MTSWFVISQLHTSDPLVNMRLFARGGFVGNIVVLGLVQFGLLAVILSSSLYLQDLLHLSPALSGLGVLPLILALAAAAQFGGRWYDRSGVRAPVLTGLGLSVIGLAGWAAALPHLGYPVQVPGMIVTGLGLGLIMSPTNTDALGRVTASERGQASGLVQTIRQLGGTLGIAVIGAVVLGIEHRGTASASTGTTDPQHAADAITVGFGCAVLVVAVAFIAGWRLLSRERLDDSDASNDTQGHYAVAG